MERPPESARPQRDLARAGLWATGSTQLGLPLTAEGLSEIICASGRLKVTPDFDVLAWVCERWLKPLGDDESEYRNDKGWALFTLRELGFALYDREPSRRDRAALRASLRRIYRVELDLLGYDAESGERDRSICTWDRLIDRVVSELDRLGPNADPAKVGALRGSTFKVQLAPWLCQQLVEGNFVRVHWPTLRSFSENQQLAKRLWIYLAAERWKPAGSREREGTWIACGDRLFAALGMDYGRPRDARAALKRACVTVRRVDPRYAAGTLELRKLGHSWRIDAERPSWAAWQGARGEHQRVRGAIREALG